MIIWIDEKSVLRNKKKIYKSGMEIPEGILSEKRIDKFLGEKKIKIVDYIEVDKSDKKSGKKVQKKSNKSVKPVQGEEKLEDKKEVKPVQKDIDGEL